jgi:iron complex outermembrane recepter protein
MHMKKFAAAAFATVSLLPLATSAFAQAAPPSDGVSNGDEIIVEARRKEESIQDVPLSIQAVTSQQLQKLEIRQFEDITKVVPGLSLSKSGSITNSSMRGIAFNAATSGSSTSVEFYRNDAVTTQGALFQAVYDIGQIEVLRGPQGTLRGRASPSGSITVTTRRPDLSQPGGYVSATGASRGKWNFNGALNVPVIADKLAIRVAGFMGASRGNNIYGLNVPLNTIDRDIYDKTRAVRASVRADPFDGVLVLDFNYETIRTSSRQYGQVQSASTYNGGAVSPITITPGSRLGVGAFAPTQENNIKLYNWQVALRHWGQRLTYVGSRQRLSLLGISNGDSAGVFATSTAQVTAPNFAPINTFGQYTNTQVTQTTHELRLQNEDRVAGLFDYVVGAFRSTGVSPTVLASQNTPTVTQTAALPFPLYRLDTFTYSARARYRNDQESSLFGNLTLHLGDATEISGGLRHIWFKADSGLKAGTFGTAAAPLDPFVSGTDIASIRRCYGNPAVAGCLPTKEATIYAASLKHKFTEELMAYFSFGTSWRPGNALVGYQGASVGTFLANYLNLPDETSKSFEIGFKSSWLDRRLRFNASAFYQKFKNYPLSAPNVYTVTGSTAATAVLVNPFSFAGPVDVTVKGLEADLGFDITRHFNLSATLAFANSKVTSGAIPCTDVRINSTGALGQDGIADTVVPTATELFNSVGTNQIGTCSVSGRSASNLPRWSGTVQAEYSHPVGFGDAFLRGFVSWKGNSEGDPTNPNDSVSAYALVDLFGGIRAENGAWEISAFAKNLLNTRRVLNRGASAATTLSSIGNLSYNYYSISTLDPREFGISARFAFGSR